METDKLLHELKRTVDELQAFNEMGKALTGTLDLQEVLRLILQRITELLQPESWALLLADPADQALIFEIAVGPNLAGWLGQRLSPGQGIPGFIAGQRRIVAHPDPTRSRMFSLPDSLLPQLARSSLLGAPLISKGKTLGAIVLQNSDRSIRPFLEEDLSLLATFADYAAIAIENARNFQRVQELTVIDDVTSLYNARHLHHILESEVLRARRYRQACSLIFIDLDHFKQINDQNGHLIGSTLLCEFADYLLRSVRNIDIVTRYGGDEFVVILPQTDKEQARLAAKRLCRNLAAHRFLTSAGLAVQLTASFGVATFPEDADSKEGLIRLADQAMYAVKKHCRNAVASAGEMFGGSGPPAG